MVSFDAYIEKKYGQYLFKDLLFTSIFVLVFIGIIFLMKPYWETGDDTFLAKIGTMTSITGVFLGTYIALWLINQNRTKKVEENFFYKDSFLVNVQGMLSSIYQINFNIKVEIEQETNDIEKINEIRESLKEEFDYWHAN